MKRTTTALIGAAMLVLAASLLTIGVAAAGKPGPPAPVTIQILNVSDWHGYVDPVGSPAMGGAWNISARWQQDREAYPTLSLTAGDDFGAAPALVNFFDDVPSIKAQRLMGIQVGTLGNHDFDRGVAHLQDMINLAGAPTSVENPGAPFRYVAANLKNREGNIEGIDPVRYFDVAGVKVAVIGIANEEAPSLVAPDAFGNLVITDGVEAANKFARIARINGSDVIVVITHKGVRGLVDGQPTGELIDFAKQVNGADVIIGDHTDVQWSGTINGTLVHENRSFGVTYAKTLLTVQPGKDGRVLAKSVSFVNPAAGTLGPGGASCPAAPAYCDKSIVDMLVPYRGQLAAKLDQKVGTVTTQFARGGNIERTREVPIGDLVADGMRWKYGTQLALMNSGGIRSTLPTCNYSPVDHTLHRPCAGYQAGAPYDLLLGDIYTLLPFGNVVTLRTVTGAQLWTALEHGVSAINGSTGAGTDGRFPQIAGFKFTFHYGNPVGSRVTSVALTDGTPIPNTTTSSYTLALPNFTNAGGDGYVMFKDDPGVSRDLDADVMRDYILANGPNFDSASYPLDRITKLP